MGKAIRMVTSIPGPKSEAILERKARVVCDPLDIHVPAVIEHGRGARITDIDGNTMLDFSGGLGCHLVGYSHPKVVEAVQKQAASFSHTDFSVIPYEIYVELAERLAALTGIPDAKVALFNAGAEAVENSIKVRQSGHRTAGHPVLRGRLSRAHTPHDDAHQPLQAVQVRVRAVRSRGLPDALPVSVPERPPGGGRPVGPSIDRQGS